MSESLRDRPDGAVRTEVREAPSGPDHIVITVHGIRTYGNWQDELKRLLEEAEPRISVVNYQYGYYSSLAFLVPPLRWLVARRFRRFALREIESAPENARIDVVAHSFGTYLVASALGSILQRRRVHTLIFAGSVLRPSFPWYKFLHSGRLGRVVNECGCDDSVLLLCQSVALMMGMAGRVGFHGMVSGQFMNRFHRGGHGGYFDAAKRFMSENWVPLLTREASIPPIDQRPCLTPLGGAKMFLLNNMQFIKVASAAALMLAAILIPLDWMHKADYHKRVERFNHIARLASAARIPGNDPSHVRDLLRVDMQDPGDLKSIDQVIGNESAPSGDDADDAELAEDDGASRWWDHVPFLRDDAREAYRARHLHARAIHQLAADKQGGPPDLSKARLLFEYALRCYKRVSEYDPAHGSYALCLIDYGRLLRKMGHPEKAAEQFRLVRGSVFPKDTEGTSSTIPPSLVVDSLCLEASALKASQRWDEAADLLLEAISKAGNDTALSSLAHTDLGWLRMERLEVAKAKESFHKAKEQCENLVEDGQFVFRTRLYYIRHGLAMAQRLCGDADGAYDQYHRLVQELQALMGNDLNFNPKERRDLRERLINSMERRADVRFFARKSPRMALAEHVADQVKPADWEKKVREAYGELLGKAERDYQEAIDQVANDDLSTKTRLLCKKVITHCLAEMGRDPEDREEVRNRAQAERTLEPIEIDYAEARKTYDTLPPELRKDLVLYHQIASKCMDLHKYPGREAYLSVDGPAGERDKQCAYAPQVVAGLRALTVEYATKCETLKREFVEMLLVALEILLEEGVETDKGKLAHDASRMMLVLGATTNVASHGELQKYADRFQAISDMKSLVASTRKGPAESAVSQAPAEAPQVARVRTSPRPPGGRVVFYLRLSPSRAIMMTDDPDGPVPLPNPALQELAAAAEPAGDEDGPALDHDPASRRTAMKPDFTRSATATGGR